MRSSSYVPPEELERARNCDLLTYLEATQPEDLVSLRNGAFCLRSHDSLKISNGKWYWWSRGIGGKSALDYLVQGEGVPLPDAVRMVNSLSRSPHQTVYHANPLEVDFELPARNTNNDSVMRYLNLRGIDPDVITKCIRQDLLYEDFRHNCCFVGYDETHTPRYAMLRSSNPSRSFLLEVRGSDKRYSFSLPPTKSTKLYVAESAIDALSLYVLTDFSPDNYLSLGGANTPKEISGLPAALDSFLMTHPHIETVCLCLDNDFAGLRAAEAIKARLPDQITAEMLPPKEEKDYNEQLMRMKGLHNQVVTRKTNKVKEELTR